MGPTCLHDMVWIQESGTLPCEKQKRRAVGSGSQGSIAPIASQEMALQHLVSTTHTFSMQLMTLMTLTHKDRILFDIWGRFLCLVLLDPGQSGPFSRKDSIWGIPKNAKVMQNTWNI